MIAKSMLNATVALVGAVAFAGAVSAQEATTNPETLRLQQETALFNARAARSTAEKAAIDAAAAAALAQANAIPSNNLGQITAGTGAGLAEGTVLSTIAMDSVVSQALERLTSSTATASTATASVATAAAPQSADVCPARSAAASDFARPAAANPGATGAGNILVLTDSQRPDLSVFRIYEARRCLVHEAYEDAETKAVELDDRLREARDGHPGPGETSTKSALVEVAGALSLAARLGGMFQRDITITGTSPTADDRLLAIMLASRLSSGSHAAVYLNTDWMGADALDDLANELDDLDARRMSAVSSLQSVENLLRLYRAGVTEGTAEKKAAYQDCIRILEEVKAEIAQATTAHEALTSWMTTAPANGTAPFNSIVQQAALNTILGDGARILVVHVHALSQGNMTERSLWTWLGGPPFSVAVSSVVTIQELSGADGKLKTGLSYLCDSGYVRMSRIHSRSSSELVACHLLGG